MTGAWVAAAVAAVTVAGASIYSSRQQSKTTKAAADQNAKIAQQQLHQEQTEFNRTNQNDVDISSILEGNTGSGTPATLLTGTNGVGRNNLILGGGNSLLGGGG